MVTKKYSENLKIKKNVKKLKVKTLHDGARLKMKSQNLHF